MLLLYTRPTGLKRRVAIASVLSAMAAAVLDASSVNVALPSIAATLKIGPSIAAWLVIAYQGALVASLLPLAAIGERLGLRPTFLAATGLFGLCALGSSLAPQFGLLIAFRTLQGVGAAGIMALGVALLRQTIDHDELGKAISWNAMTVALFSAAGPTIGAALLGVGGWRFVFAGSVALAAASLALGIGLPSRNVEHRELDGTGIVIYVAIVPALVLAAGLARTSAFGGTILLVSGLIGLYLLVRRDLRRTHPFLPLDLFRLPVFNRSVLASIACFTAMSLTLLILPFALHSRLGLSAHGTALMLTPWPLAVLATTPLTTALLDHVHPAKLTGGGCLLLSCGMAILGMSAPTSGVNIHVLGVTLCGAGFGLFQTPNNRTMFLSAAIDRSAAAGGVQGTARLTGQVAGSLIASMLLSALAMQHASSVAFGLATLFALVAAGISFAMCQNVGSPDRKRRIS